MILIQELQEELQQAFQFQQQHIQLQLVVVEQQEWEQIQFVLRQLQLLLKDQIQYFQLSHQLVVVVDLDAKDLPILIQMDQEVLVEEIREML